LGSGTDREEREAVKRHEGTGKRTEEAKGDRGKRRARRTSEEMCKKILFKEGHLEITVIFTPPFKRTE